MKVTKISSEFLKERYEWINSKNIYSYMNIQYPMSFEDVTGWYERNKNNSKRIDFIFLEDDKPVAMTGLTNLDLENGLIEFYIMVAPDSQGKGFGEIATQWTMNYAFLWYNINKVYSYTNGFNQRVNNMLEKIGLKHEGTLRQHKFKNGVYIDRCFYGILKEDWNKQEYKTDTINLDF